MQYIPGLVQGLWVTLFLSFISLIIGAIPGSLFFLGKISKIKILYVLSTLYIELFEGIPVIVQLFFVYYALPMVTPIFTLPPTVAAIIVLSLNAAANIASVAKSHTECGFITPTTSNCIKVLTISLIDVSRKVIGYSALLSIIAVTDLLRMSHKIMSATNDVIVFVAAIATYLIMSVILKAIYKLLKRVFFVEIKENKI